MSKIYITTNNEILDKIVYNHYGTLLYFKQVLMANPKLEPPLKTGNKVILPNIKPKENKEKSLW
ncbi:tail protein X [Campylobacter jejuni]|uniref:Phage tail protein n=1 Tax=Campylobacter upsaliensis TaxID=28080 RepID=A0A5L4R5Q0_CAMUP|nr:tail protein X [Campylobacter upsaliensis]EJW4143361.1 tail protein X [Campylobacter jejuni]EAH5218057.1 phage tail protein [Campylobacter upsaliensis]EAH5847761.1 phage tail protein [Campylobacter upsaliensis]EAH5879361.1 phage tail protein [Campylobacter upsaliensis]EAH5977731.1 phage tail protein [Campylobacter upsaliensis]